MKTIKHAALGVLLVFGVACGGHDPQPAAPSAVLKTSDFGTAPLSGLAVGDVGGPLQIFNVTVRPEGAAQFYANPGGSYRVPPNVPVAFWVEWRSETTVANAPRLVIEWGFAEADNIHCGPCQLSKTFPTGVFTVTIKLDDRAGGVTRRTFSVDTRPLIDGVQITASGEAFGHHGACSGWNSCGNAATCALWACEVKGFSELVSFGADRPCTEFAMCHLFNSRGSVQYNWGNWCAVRGVTDIVCR